MRIVKQIITTAVCTILSKFAQAQVHLPDTIYMYTKNEKLYLDSIPFVGTDTLYAKNNSGRFEEQALTLIGKEERMFDVLSMCCNRSTPKRIKLLRIGNSLFRIGERIVIKIDEHTLKAFAKSFEYSTHCDHASHASHYSSF